MRLKHLILLVLISQTANAFNYTNLPELNLTIETPPYEIVWDYNIDQSNAVDEVPLEVKPIDDMPFKNAWIKIMALEKTIHDTETNISVASREGRILVKYDYISTCPPSTYDWDRCRGRRYKLVGWNEELRIYANGEYEGNSKIESYSIPCTENTLELRAELYLEVECKRYSLEEYEINETEYCEEEYDGLRYYDGIIEDSVTYLTSDMYPEANLTFKAIAENPFEASKGILTVEAKAPYSKLEARIGGKSLTYSGNAYDIEAYLPNYNLLRISTYDLPHIIESNLFSRIYDIRDNTTGEINTTIEFILTYEETKNILSSKNCEITLTDLFQNEVTIENLCEGDWKQTKIETVTNGKIYANGDEIQIRAVLTHEVNPIADKQVLIYYAGDEFSGITDERGMVLLTFTAEYPYNRIDVIFPGEDHYLSSSRTLLIATTGSRLNAIILRILPPLLILLVSIFGIQYMLRFAGVVK